MGPELNNVILLADSYKIRKCTIRITHFKNHITLLTYDKLFHPSPTPLWKNFFRLFNTEVQNGDNKRLTKKHLVKGFTKLMTIIRFPQIFKHFIRNKCIIIYVKTIFFK